MHRPKGTAGLGHAQLLRLLHDDDRAENYAREPLGAGRSVSIHLARVYGERKRNFVGQSFWARGYFVNTVGRDETMIREYIRKQEKEDWRLAKLNLWR